mgnify:CR=1 FL=1
MSVTYSKINKSEEDRRVKRTQASRPKITNGIPNNSEGINGDIRYGNLRAGGIKLFIKINNQWHSFTPDNTNSFSNVIEDFKKITYTITNLTIDRTYNANSTSTAELADILGTLITDLSNLGILKVTR